MVGPNRVLNNPEPENMGVGPGRKETLMVAAALPGNVAAPIAPKKPFYRVLYVQVLFAILLGGVVGWLYPEFATN